MKYTLHVQEHNGHLDKMDVEQKEFWPHLHDKDDDDVVYTGEHAKEDELRQRTLHEFYPMYLMYTRREKFAAEEKKINEMSLDKKQCKHLEKREGEDYRWGMSNSEFIQNRINRRLSKLLKDARKNANPKRCNKKGVKGKDYDEVKAQRDVVYQCMRSLSFHFKFSHLVEFNGYKKYTKTRNDAAEKDHNELLVTNLTTDLGYPYGEREHHGKGQKKAIEQQIELWINNIKDAFKGEKSIILAEKSDKTGEEAQRLFKDYFHYDSRDYPDSKDGEEDETSWWPFGLRTTWCSFCFLVMAGALVAVFWPSPEQLAAFGLDIV